MQAEQVAPKSLIAEGIEAEDLPAFADRLSRVCVDQAVVWGEFVLGRPRLGASFFPGVNPEPDEKRDTKEWLYVSCAAPF